MTTATVGTDGVTTRTELYECESRTLVETAIDTYTDGDTVAVCETEDGWHMLLAVDDITTDPRATVFAAAVLTPAEARRLGTLLMAWALDKMSQSV